MHRIYQFNSIYQIQKLFKQSTFNLEKKKAMAFESTKVCRSSRLREACKENPVRLKIEVMDTKMSSAEGYSLAFSAGSGSVSRHKPFGGHFGNVYSFLKDNSCILWLGSFTFRNVSKWTIKDASHIYLQG